MDNVSFNVDNAKVKVTERSRGRMKIQIKLSKEEAEGFKNFMLIKPDELDEETFYKQIFFAGCNTMFDQIQQMVAQHKAEKETAEGESDEQAES